MRPLQDAIVGDASRPIWVLQAAVGFVLLIVCANLANLVMARAGSRRREFALRAALGASRGRLLRQSITEGAVLSGAGGILGLWLASAGVRALIRAYPTSIPRTSELTIDLPVLLVALGLSMATALLFGFAPVAQGRIDDMVTALKEGGDEGPAALASSRPSWARDGPSRFRGDAGYRSGFAGPDSLQPHEDRCRI